MKKVNLEKVLAVLEGETEEVKVSEETRVKSLIPLERMLELGN